MFTVNNFTRRWLIRVVFVALAICTMSCNSGISQDSILIAVGFKDPPPPPKPTPPPPPPRYMVDVVIDSASKTAEPAAIEEVFANTVDFVATMDPKSEIRLWILNDSDAQLVNLEAAPKGGRVAAAKSGATGIPHSAEATLQVERLLAAYAGTPKSQGSPIAEALTKVSLAAPVDRRHWHVVVLTDGIQESAPCDDDDTPRAAPHYPTQDCQPRFNCTPPQKPDWLKYLAQQRLLPVGNFSGAEISFVHFEPTAHANAWSDHPCLPSMAFAQALEDLWRAGLVERTAARVKFELRGPTFPKPTPPAMVAANMTKEGK